MGERLSAAKLSKAPKDAEPPDEAPSAVELCRKGQGVADAKACDTHQSYQKARRAKQVAPTQGNMSCEISEGPELATAARKKRKKPS